MTRSTSSLLALMGALACAVTGWWLLGDTEPSTLASAVPSSPEAAVHEVPAGREPPQDDAGGVRTVPLQSDVTPQPGVISGTVEDARGVFLEGARVRVELHAPSGRRHYALVASFDEERITDADGRFRLPVPGGGIFRVSAAAEGHAPAQRTDVLPGEVVRLVLGTSATLEGIVLEQETGRALAQVQVKAQPSSDLPPLETETDVQGRFRFVDLPAGRLEVTLEDAEHVSPEPVEQEVVQGKVHEVTLRMAAGKRIRGMVMAQDDGIPVRDAHVTVGTKEGISDERGRFLVRGLPSEPLQVVVSAPGFIPRQRSVNLSGSRTEAEVQMLLVRGASVSGRITDPDGMPVPDVRLKLFMSWGSSMQEDWEMRKVEVLSDETGHYDFPGIPARGWGQYVLRARHPGYPCAVSERFQIKKSDERMVQDIQFHPGARVSGRVLDQDRQPLEGVRLSLNQYGVWEHGQTPGELVTGSGPEGGFVFEGVGDGRYQITAMARGFSSASDRVEVTAHRDASYVELVLARGNPVAGIVTDLEEAPLAGAEVRLSVRGGDGTAVSDQEGHFEIEALPDGPYRVSASLEGYGMRSQGQVRPEADGLIHVRLAPRGVVKGQVLDAATGEPLERFRVVLSDEDERRPGYRRTRYDDQVRDPEGRFTVQMGDGTYRLEILASGYVRHREENVAFAAGDIGEERVIRLRKGGAIEGYVRDGRGGALGGTQVYRRSSLAAEQRYLPSGETEHDGYFFLGDLDAGSHDLLFKREGYPLAFYDAVPVGGEEPTWVDVTLQSFTKLEIRLVVPKQKIAGAPVATSTWFDGRRMHRRVRRPRTTITLESLDHQPVALSRQGRDSSRRGLYSPSKTRTWNQRGSTTLKVNDLQPGRYQVKGQHPGLPPIIRWVQLDHGFERTVELNFTALAKEKKLLVEEPAEEGAPPHR